MVAPAPSAPSSPAGPPAQGRSASRSASDRRGAIEVLPENDVFDPLARRRPDRAIAASCTGRPRPHRSDFHPGRRRFSGQTRSGRYCRARYYHTDLQRFISEDPIGLLGGDANVFAYVRNNPIRFVDPIGLRKTTASTSKIPLVFLGIQASAFLGEIFPTGSRSAGAGKEVTLGLVIDPNTGAIRAFKSVGVATRDEPDDVVAGANIGLGPVAGVFGGPLSSFFGEATEETLTGIPPGFSFTRIETSSGDVGTSGSLSLGGSFTRIRTFTSPLFGQ